LGGKQSKGETNNTKGRWEKKGWGGISNERKELRQKKNN
jgi:hypothetical protein